MGEQFLQNRQAQNQVNYKSCDGFFRACNIDEKKKGGKYMVLWALSGGLAVVARRGKSSSPFFSFWGRAAETKDVVSRVGVFLCSCCCGQHRRRIGPSPKLGGSGIDSKSREIEKGKRCVRIG